MPKLSLSIVFALLSLIAHLTIAAETAPAPTGSKPNIIFVVADDMGHRDTGYSRNPVVKTPHLDAMAAEGLRFDSFYAAHATCSPGRMAILTGRTPLRARMVTTVGPMQEGEVTVAMALKTAGYETAHFGKWGVGTGGTHPLKVGFDEAIWSKGFFENGASFFVGDSDKRDERPVKTTGESSMATMDLALDFIGKRAARKQPFFVQVSFGSPHGPHVAAEEFKKFYSDLPEKEQNLWGEVSGLDAAVGKLRQELSRLNIAGNTLLWFVSDNGGISEISGKIDRKGTIGAKTMGLLEWPDKIARPMRTAIPVCHIDMYPTVLDIVGVKLDHQPVLDGISLLPLFEGKMESRPKALGFTGGRYADKEDPTLCEITNGAWIDGRLMLRIKAPTKNSKKETVALYDIVADPEQQKDLAAQQPEKAKAMQKALAEWQESVKESFAGKDYLPTKP
jgi:arylsulfatase A-like enzyme